MLDFLNSLGKKIVSQPERVSTDTYSDAITGQVKDTVSDYVQNFPITDPELYSKLPVGMVGSALSIPAETANLASYIPFSPYKPLRESGALEPYRKDATLNFLFNLGSKLNPESTTFQRTGSPTEEYALGVLPDVLIGFGAPTITKIPSLAKKADDFIQTRTATDLGDITEALALAGQTRQSPLSLASMTGEASLGKTTFPRELDENYFFNKAYEISRNLDQEKGTPDQFRSMFEKGGVTKDEFRWSGLGEYLKEQKQANLPVTKEGLTDFLNENRMSVNIKDLTEEVDYDTPEELTFETVDLTAEDPYVRERVPDYAEMIHQELKYDEDYTVNELMDVVFKKKMNKVYDKKDLEDFFIAKMKIPVFPRVTKENTDVGNLVIKANALKEKAYLVTNDKIPLPNFVSNGIEQRVFLPSDRAKELQELIDEMPLEKAYELSKEWDDFRKNSSVGYASENLFELPQNPNFSELYESFGSYGQDFLEKQPEIFASLSEEYPEFFANEGFNSVDKLRDWQSQVDDALYELAERRILNDKPHEIKAYDPNNNLVYSAIGDNTGMSYLSPELDLDEVTDPNVVRDRMFSAALDDGVIQYRSSELYEDLTPPDVFGTREAYNVNLYEDTSDLARKEFELTSPQLGSGRFRERRSIQEIEETQSSDYQEMIPRNLQGHFYEYSNQFPIGHVRSTIRDLDGQGVEFEDDYLKYKNIYLDEGATKSSNLDGKVYAIHELQSDVAQQLTSPRSSDMTPSGLEKAKNEARKAIGKNPESKMMEFDEKAETLKEKSIEFVEKYVAWANKSASEIQNKFPEQALVKSKGRYKYVEEAHDPEVINFLFDRFAGRLHPQDQFLSTEKNLTETYMEIIRYLDLGNATTKTLADTPYSLLREKEKIADDLDDLLAERKSFRSDVHRLEKLERTKPTVMDAPYIQEKRDTTKIMLKGEIAKAVDANADYVTLGEPEFNKNRQGFTDAEEFYGVAVPKIAEKILKPLDPDIKLINLDVGTGEVVKGFKITEKLKKALREQGQSYFAPFTAIGTGILGSQVAKEQENSYE